MNTASDLRLEQNVGVDRRTDPSRLFWRFYGGLIAVVVLFTFSVEWVAVRRERADDIRQIRQELRRMAYVFGELSSPAIVSGDAVAIARVTETARVQGVRLTVVAADGRVLADSRRQAATMSNHLSRAEIQAALRTGGGEAERAMSGSEEHGLYYAVSIVRDGVVRGFVRTGATDGDVTLHRTGMLRRLALGSVTVAAGALGLGFLFTRRLARQFHGELDRLLLTTDLLCSTAFVPRQFHGELDRLLRRDALYDQLKANEQRLTVNESRLTERTAELDRANADLSILAAIVESSDAAIFSKGRDGVVLTWNRSAERMFGYTPAEMIGSSIDRLLANGAVAEEREVRTRVFATGVGERQQTRRVRKDGTTFAAAVISSPIVLPDGAMTGVAVMVRDVSDELAQRARLVESESRLNNAQEIGRIGSWTWDVHSNRVTWSAQVFRNFGLMPGEVEPTYDLYLALVHPEDRELVLATLRASMQALQSFDYQHRVLLRDGTTRFHQARGDVITGADGAPIMLIGTSQDVTDRAVAEGELRLSEERFQLAARATSEGIWDWDCRGNVT